MQKLGGVWERGEKLASSELSRFGDRREEGKQKLSGEKKHAEKQAFVEKLSSRKKKKRSTDLIAV